MTMTAKITVELDTEKAQEALDRLRQQARDLQTGRGNAELPHELVRARQATSRAAGNTTPQSPPLTTERTRMSREGALKVASARAAGETQVASAFSYTGLGAVGLGGLASQARFGGLTRLLRNGFATKTLLDTLPGVSGAFEATGIAGYSGFAKGGINPTLDAIDRIKAEVYSLKEKFMAFLNPLSHVEDAAIAAGVAGQTIPMKFGEQAAYGQALWNDAQYRMQLSRERVEGQARGFSEYKFREQQVGVLVKDIMKTFKQWAK